MSPLLTLTITLLAIPLAIAIAGGIVTFLIGAWLDHHGSDES